MGSTLHRRRFFDPDYHGNLTDSEIIFKMRPSSPIALRGYEWATDDKSREKITAALYNAALDEMAHSGQVYSDLNSYSLPESRIAIPPPHLRSPYYLERISRGKKTDVVYLGVQLPESKNYDNYSKDRGHVWFELPNPQEQYTIWGHYGIFTHNLDGSNSRLAFHALQSNAISHMTDNWHNQKCDFAIAIPITETQRQLLEIDRQAIKLMKPSYNAVSASCENYTLQSLQDVGIDISNILDHEPTTIPFKDLGLRAEEFADHTIRQFVAGNPDHPKITSITLANDIRERIQSNSKTVKGISYSIPEGNDHCFIDLSTIDSPIKLSDAHRIIRAHEGQQQDIEQLELCSQQREEIPELNKQVITERCKLFHEAVTSSVKAKKCQERLRKPPASYDGSVKNYIIIMERDDTERSKRLSATPVAGAHNFNDIYNTYVKPIFDEMHEYTKTLADIPYTPPLLLIDGGNNAQIVLKNIKLLHQQLTEWGLVEAAKLVDYTYNLLLDPCLDTLVAAYRQLAGKWDDSTRVNAGRSA